MEDENEIEPELDPDKLAKKLGVPMPGPVDPLTYNNNVIGMYRKVAEQNVDRPTWVKISAVIVGIGFSVPFLVYAIMFIDLIKNYGMQAIGSGTMLLWPLLFLIIGIKIIYENIKSINKKLNK